MSEKKIPFLWGAATSSHQIEGGNRNDWTEWEDSGSIMGGVVSGKSTDHWNRYEEDIELAAQMGINSYRFSIEWSRVEPEEGVWNQESIDWYLRLIRLCKEKSIEPMVTLHHFTIPIWFSKRGGFVHQDSSSFFLRYVNKVLSNLKNEVKLWCTLNEPMVYILGGYIARFMPPAVYAPKLVSDVILNMVEAHVLAYDAIKEHERKIRLEVDPSFETQVGFAQNMIWFKADRKWHPIENLLKFGVHRFYNMDFLNLVLGRKRWVGAPGFIKVKKVKSKYEGKLDFIGLNYYTKGHIKWRPRASGADSIPEMPVGLSFARRKEPQSDLGWSFYPKGLGKFLSILSKYKLPIIITENGLADKEDRFRRKFLVDHLRVISSSIKNGVNILGYYHWSLLDNFEWIHGYGPRFGLIKVDYKTFARQKTKSADLYQSLIEKHLGEPPRGEILDLCPVDD